jgi:hypothetical protein
MIGLGFSAYDLSAFGRARQLIEPIIAFWPFARTSGTTLHDVGPNALHLTSKKAANAADVGSFDTPPSRVGATVAITVNGSSEWLVGSDADALTRSGQPMSVGAWIKNVTVPSNVVIAKNTDVLPNPQEWVFWERDTDGKLQLWLFDSTDGGSIKTTANSALDTNWRFVVGTYDGGSAASGIDLYVDGALVASTDATAGSFSQMRNTNTAVSVGAIHDIGGTGQDWFHGSIALPFVSAARLSASQVSQLYTVTRAIMGL